MKLLKKPTFWLVLAFLVFLGWVALGYTLPAQVRFQNETGGEIKNLTLSYGTDELKIDKLLAGESKQLPVKLPSGELTLSLETAGGSPHSKQFPHTAGPREKAVFHIVDTREVVKLFETRTSRISTSNEYTFNMGSSEQ